ncbi:MAG: 4-alpha-glucanotransferase, partial [Candidatus Omnitrophica bacterium]|nr:4-alpha-glucanotransferase [Candidatus Omnitrophota bacterium]
LARAMGMPVDAVPRNFARRTLGLLVPLHALPRGIEDLEDLSEWAKQRGITWLQFLPLMEGDPAIETSPYSSWSAFAAKPLPIVPERVPEVQRSKEALDKLRHYRPILDAVHRAGRRSQIEEFRVLYEVMWPAYRLFRDRVLTSTAAQDVRRAEEFRAYQQRNPWLKDYAAFRTLHSRYPDGWMTMPEELRDRHPGAVERLFRQDTALADMAQFYQYLQFVFDQQWTAWRSLSHRNGTFSLGDIPVYIAANSDLVWANQSSFNPAIESSCPPDLFTPAGQIWGHWTWDIPELRRTLFDVWMQRVVRGAEMTDGTRIDHVRFMYDFYGIPLLPDAERWLGKEAGKLTLRDAVSKLSDAWKSKVWVSEANPPVQGLPFPVETTAAILPGLPQRDQTLFGNLSPIQRDPFDRAMRMLEGAWNEGPGDELMQRISAVITFDRLGLLVAEDLGLLSDGVRPLLERTGTPGMAPVVFGISFDEKTEEVKFFGPYWDVGEAPPDLFVFSTNHDSDTFRGMLEAWGARYAGKALPQLAKKLQAEGHLAADFNLHQPDLDMVEPIHFALLLKVLRSPALQAFVSYQDLLRLTIEDNKPGVVSPENWSVVMPVSPKELLENKTERAQAINARTDALLRAPGVDRAPAPIIPGERPRILRMLPQPGGRTKVLQLRRHRDPVLGNVQAWAVVSPARDQIGRGRQPKAEMVVETGGTETALPMRLYSVLEDGTLLYYGQAPAERFPPGEYTLHTRVQGTDGTWHTDMEYGAAPRLVIEPAAGLEESGEILRAVDETAWAQLQAFGARLRELGLSWDRPVQITGVWTDKDYTLLNGDTGKTIHPSLAGDFAWMMDRGKKVVVVTADTPESVEQQVWLPIQGVPGDPAGRRARMRTFARSGGSRVFYPGGQRAVEPGGSVLTERQQTVLIRAFAEILLPQMGQPRDLAAAADFNAVKDVLVAAEQAAGLLRPNDVPVQIEPENPTMFFITFADGTLNSEEIVRQARAKIEQELQGEPAIIHFSCGPYYVAAGLYNKPSTTSRFLSVEFETEKEPGVLIVMGDGSLDDLGMIRAAAESRRHLILPCFVGDPEAIQPGEPVLVPDGRRYVEAARSVVGNVVKAEKLGLAYDQMEFIRGRFSVRQIAEALSVPTDAFLREILPSGFAGFERLRQARSAGLEEEWILVVGPSPEKIRQVIDSAKRSCPSAQFSSFMVGVDRAEFRNFISHSHLFRGALLLPFDSDDQAAERVSQWSTANDFLDTLKIPKVVLRDVSDSSVDQAVAQLLAYEVKDPILRRIKLLYRFTEKAWTEWTEGLRTPEGQLPFILFLKGRYRREPDLKSAGVLWPDLVRLYWNSEELPRRPPKESWREIYLYAVTAQIFYRLSIRYGDPEQSTDPQAILEALAPEITMLPQILFGQPAREIGLDGSETAEILRRIEQARKMIGLPAAGLEERTFLYNKFKVRSALLPEAPPPYSKVEIAVHGHLWGIPGNPLWQSFAGLRNVSWKSVSYHPDDAADELKGFVSDEAVWRIVILDPRYFPKEQLAQKLPAGHAPVFLMSPASAKLFTPAVAAEIMDMRPRADLPPIYDLELEEDDVYGGLLLSISA